MKTLHTTVPPPPPLELLETPTDSRFLLIGECFVHCSLGQVLISTLAQSKVTSNIIERKVKEAAKTQEIIAKTRTGYIPIAFRASQLFFCIADLGTVDPMYQVFSFDMYTEGEVEC